MALALSMYGIGVLQAKSDNSSNSRRFNQTKSLVPSLTAMISPSAVEKDVGFCSQLIQDTALSENVAIIPVMERLVTLSSAKSATLKTFSSPEPAVYPKP